MLKHIGRVAVFLLALMPATAFAGDTLAVPDTSKLKWAISAGKVYFRNFDEIDASWQGCCYAYYIDLSNDEGKAMFSAFLTKRSANQPLSFWVQYKSSAPSRIEMVGDW